MKFLLFLFLIASLVCKGQTDRNPHDFYSDTVEVGYTKCSLQDKLLQYAQECWNDSTQEEHPTHIFAGHTPTCEYREGFSNGKLSCINPSHYARKVTHRKPTFEGFIEWLKKK